jgi:hypothetical protein
MPLILLENKIIKYHYIVKGRGDNNIFNGSSDIIGSGKDNIIEPRKFIVKKTDKDVKLIALELPDVLRIIVEFHLLVEVVFHVARLDHVEEIDLRLHGIGG